MKKILLIVIVIALIAGAIAFYLASTTPSRGAGLHFPLTEDQHDLLDAVPASAEAFAFIPAASVFHAKLLANPITRGPLEELGETQSLPRPWMIGGADLVIWRAGKKTSYATHLDPLRAAVVRTYLMFASGVNGSVSSGTFLINAGAGEPLGRERIDQLLAMARSPDLADAVIVQQSASRGTFPPIDRPAVTTIKVNADDILLTSRARISAAQTLAGEDSGAPLPPPMMTRPRFPKNALLAATFHEPPRIVGDLDRLFIARLSHLLDDGGSIVLYDVNAGTLLPRPDGLIIANATPENQKTVEKISGAVKTFGEIRQSGDQILLSFDQDSMQKYATDPPVEAQWPSNDWAARIDAKRAVPLLERLGDNTGLRLAASRIYRSVRDLRRWIEALSTAGAIEASHSVTGQTEEMRVRISSK